MFNQREQFGFELLSGDLPLSAASPWSPVKQFFHTTGIEAVNPTAKLPSPNAKSDGIFLSGHPFIQTTQQVGFAICDDYSTGIDAALRVAEIEGTRKGVGPEGKPAHQIVRSFNHHQLPRWPLENEAELATVEAKTRPRVENQECWVSFSDRVVVCVRHMKVTRAVHRNTGRLIEARDALRVDPESHCLNAWKNPGAALRVWDARGASR